MAGRISKRLLDPRVRRIREGFSWIDRRFVREGWIERLSRDETLLYLFLVCVADHQGLSYWSDGRTATTLGITREELERARVRLVELDLLAYSAPLYQVLALEPRPRRGDGGPKSFGDILRMLAAGDEPHQ